MKRILIALAAVSITAASAWAYIPPSSFIIKSVAAKHAVKGLRIRSIVTVMDGDKPGTVHFKSITYFNPQTESLHVYAFDEHNQKLFSAERRPDTATGADALLFWTNGRSLDIALKARGLPIRTEDELLQMKDEDDRRSSEDEHLTRLNSAIAWMIGGGHEGAPALWIEKDSFLPLRMSASPQPESDPVDLTFDGQRYYHEFPFPRTITATKKKIPLFRDEVQDVSIALETAEFRSTVVPGFTENGNNASGALHDLVQKYFEILR